MPPRGVHHVDLVVSDLERALGFYRELLGPLGWTGIGEAPGERDETIVYPTSAPTRQAIGLRRAPADRLDVPVDRYRLGLHHLALAAETDAEVDAAAARARALGARVTDGPREFPQYLPGYYAVFLCDPDDLKLEIVSYENVGRGHPPREEFS